MSSLPPFGCFLPLHSSARLASLRSPCPPSPGTMRLSPVPPPLSLGGSLVASFPSNPQDLCLVWTRSSLPGPQGLAHAWRTAGAQGGNCPVPTHEEGRRGPAEGSRLMRAQCSSWRKHAKIFLLSAGHVFRCHRLRFSCLCPCDFRVSTVSARAVPYSDLPHPLWRLAPSQTLFLVPRISLLLTPFQGL